MKPSIFILSLLLIACSADEPVKDDAFNDENWIRLEIPKGREAYAIAGNIDDTLLVSTWTKVYYTTDQGKTWIESYDFKGPAFGLLQVDDAIYALRSTHVDLDGNFRASMAQYVTEDHGEHWESAANPDLTQRIGMVESSGGPEYLLKINTTPTSPGASTYYVNPTEIMKKYDGKEETIVFGYKHNILNLHVDSDDRLYLAVSGATYLKEKNTFECCAADLPAIVYVSRRANP